MQALTARRQEDNAARLEAERASERARAAAQRAAALSARQAAEEEEKRQAARAALERQKSLANERAAAATQSARRSGLPPMKNIGLAMKTAPTERAARAKRRKARPEWGQGHAGGARMRKDNGMRFAPLPSEGIRV